MADQQNMNDYRPPMHPNNFPPPGPGAPPMMPPQFPGKQAPMGFPPQPFGQGGMPPMSMNQQGPPNGPSGDLFNRTVPAPPAGGMPPPMAGAQGQRLPPPAGGAMRPPGPPTAMVGPPSSIGLPQRGPPPQTFGGQRPPLSAASMTPPPHPGLMHPPAASQGINTSSSPSMPPPPHSMGGGQHAPGMVNGVNSSPQQPQPPTGVPLHPGAQPPGPLMANGPYNGPSPPLQGPFPGQRPPGPGGMQPPPPSSFANSPPRPPGPGGAGPPPTSRPTNLGGMSNTPPPLSSTPAMSPGGLPVPFHGQAQYSHQLGVNRQSSAALTPTNSEPASQKSSRAPSPVPGIKYDALEGQFPNSPPGSQAPPFPGQPTSSPPGPPGLQNHVAPPANFPMPGGMPPSSMPGPGGMPPSSMPGPGGMPHSSMSGPGGMPPMAGQINQPGMPLMAGQMNQPGMPPMAGQMNQPGMPPMAGQMNQPGMPPQPGMMQPPQPGMPPHPGMAAQPPVPQQPGVPPFPSASGPPTSMGTGIAGRRQYPQMPGQPQSHSQVPPGHPGIGGVTQPGMPPTYQPPGATQGMGNNTMPPGPGMQPNHVPNNTPNQNANLSSSFGRMSLQQQMEGRPINLLQERNLIPPDGIPDQKPNLAHDFKKVNCNPEIFRCTLSTLPNTQSLLNKSRLPLGILIHPFKDLSQLPVIQSSVIVRCRSCRTYINPFVNFVDMRRWKCNLCYRVNELPDEFNYDPVSKTYGEPQRRPEIRSSTIEFIAPSEYMLRPPQPAVYLFVLDVSFNAVSTGYLQIFCQTLLDELDRVPGDARTQIGFITFDSCVHFYNLAEGLSQPQMHVVGDVDDIFLPCPDNLLVNLTESKELVIDLLNQLPSMFEKNVETGSALGAALQAAYKMMSPTGGRVSLFQTMLPNVGPGSLKNREDPNERAGKNVQHLGPATDFYKKLSLECSGQQIAVDLFMLNSQYADMATVGCIAKYSGGSLYYFPGLHVTNNPAETERFEGTLRRYLTRKVGFEAVMRIRCTRGLSIHTFHGNFFVRSTDLLSLPNINPDAGFGMQMSIEDTLETNTCCFQAALLYTSSKGERRIRVHTMCLPVTKQLTDVYSGADQKAIIGLLGKMAVDRCISSSMGDARDAMLNAAVDMLSAYGGTLPAAQRMGQLACAYQTRLMPLFVLAMLKFRAFRIGSSTKLDDRVHSLEQIKTLPLSFFLLELYPNLFPVHALDDQNAINKNDVTIPQPGLLHLSAANIDRHGAYLLDTGSRMTMWVGAAVSDVYCQEVFDVPNFSAIQDGQCELPELDNETSDRLRTFIQYRQDQRPFPASFHVIREDSRSRGIFLQYLVEDRTESTMSYYEFLQHLQKEAK